jgi:hypothetical protein
VTDFWTLILTPILLPEACAFEYLDSEGLSRQTSESTNTMRLKMDRVGDDGSSQ